MKRFIAVAVLFTLVICLLSCSYEGTYDDGYEDGYDDGRDYGWYDGYDEGYSEGYWEGVAEAQHDIANFVDDDLWSLEWDIEHEYGTFPEDALQILTNYIDDPDSISEEELYTAIYAIRSYYFASQKIPSNIEDYWID